MSCALVERRKGDKLLAIEPYVGDPCASPVGATPSALDFTSLQIAMARRHFAFPLSRSAPSDASRFYDLATLWRSETQHLSKVRDIAMHPAYQRIIGMGREALPLILRELAEHREHWFWALKAITGLDPVPPEHRGNLREMAGAWLRWGREQGLLAENES